MSETQALTVTDEQALALLNEMDLTPQGFKENVKPEDIAQPPRLRIAQRASGDMPEGTLYNTMTGTMYGKAVEVIFLAWENDTCVMWPPVYDKDNDPECASDNGKMPSASSDRRRLTNPQKGPCTSCEWAKFGKNGERPRCSRQRNCIVWLVEDRMPIRLTLQGSSIPTSKALTNLSKSCNVRKAITIVSNLEDNDKGRYYVYLFTESNSKEIAKMITPALSYELWQLSKSLEFSISADADDAETGYTPDDNADVINGAATPVEDKVPF